MKALNISNHPGSGKIFRQAILLQNYFDKNIKGGGKGVSAAAWQKRIARLRKAAMHEFLYQLHSNPLLVEKISNGFSATFDFNVTLCSKNTGHRQSKTLAMPYRLNAGAVSSALLAAVNSCTDYSGNSVSTLQVPSERGGKRKLELGGITLDLNLRFAEIEPALAGNGIICSGTPLEKFEATLRQYLDSIAMLPANLVDALARMAE